jgi:hypothetical protein
MFSLVSDETRLELPLTLTAKDAAQLLGISESTFYSYRDRGHFKGCEAALPGRWSRDAIVALANGQRPFQSRSRKSA